MVFFYREEGSKVLGKIYKEKFDMQGGGERDFLA